MSIACPYCDHTLNLKSPRPGRFRPKCPACAKPFVLIVPTQSSETLKVRALGAETSLIGKSREDRLRGRAAGLEATQPPVGSSEILVASTTRVGHEQPLLAISKPAAAPEVFEEKLPAVVVESEPVDSPAPLRLDVPGYAIERELGRGGMGTVYLARQLSLDRNVALKVMGKRWATDPIFVARFTREAYAAAQLSHPNIVQIFDIGEINGTRFFSMEYVPGHTLAELVKLRGKLDTETAVGYVLQAARGLKHAHDRGMIHRDVKPDNLMLDEQGLVKVGDLGLVKTAGTRRVDDQLTGRHVQPDGRPVNGLGSLPADMTGARIALGTPAYMSPEQCRDAANVDHRADIYSLGCTLYVLVTGRQPFNGTTAVELMTKHAYEPLVPPEHIVARVPKEVSEIIQRMMEKDANDRFQSMGEVIRTLEAWLGIRRAGTFSPHEEQISRLEGYVHQFNYAPTAVLRRRIVGGFFAVFALSTVLIAFFGNLVWAFGLFGMVAQAGLAYFVLDGFARGGHLFGRTRQFVMGLSWGDWAIAAASVGLFAILLAMLHSFWIWVGFGLIGVGLAFALRYGLDRTAEEERREPVEACERVLRRLREQGLDEEEIQHFVAKFAGREWEAFFEALFGFDAKLAARAVLLRGGAAGARDKYAAWREPLIAAMERIEKGRQAARERKLLQAVERAELLAAGTTPEAAEKKAKAAADAMVQAAARVREVEQDRVRALVQPSAGATPVNVHLAVAAAEQNPFVFIPNPKRDPFGAVVNAFVGPHLRAIAAAMLIAACALWVYQNGLVPSAELHGQARQAMESRDLAGLQQAVTHDLRKPTHPLVLAGVPHQATSWMDGWNVGAAGLLLLASLFCRGNVMSIFALLGATVAAIGHHYGIRTVEPFRAEHVALMLGAVLALVGFRLGR